MSLRRMYRTRISDEGLPNIIELKLGDKKFAFVKKLWEVGEEHIGLRYGTNPHQAAAFYVPEDPEQWYFGDMEIRKVGKQGLSATNLEDGYRALRIAHYFTLPAVSVMKHLNPTGVGYANDPDETGADILEKAWGGDPRAAFGGVVGMNSDFDDTIAENIVKTGKYVECIFAPGCWDESLEVLKNNKNIRIVEVPNADDLLDRGLPYEIKVFSDGILLEEPFSTKFRSLDDLYRYLHEDEKTRVVTETDLEYGQMEQLLYAWWVCGEKRSNGVVIWKDDRALSVGTGQQDRIGAIEIALNRAKRVGHDLEDSVLASDGFMLKDNISPLAEVGISAIAQPGGSIDDKQTIAECDEHGIAMLFTGERVFRHF